MQLALTIPLTTLKSWSAPETVRAVDRSLELSQNLNNTQQLLQSMMVKQFAHSTRAEHRAALAIAEQRYNLIQRLEEPLQMLFGHMGLAMTCMFVGQFARSLQHMEQTIALYDIDFFLPLFAELGSDPGVGALSIGLYDLWYLGYPDQALKRSHEGLNLAQDLNHPFALHFLLTFKSRLHRWRYELAEVQHIAETQMDLWREHNIEMADAVALLDRAWVLSEKGHPDAGIKLYKKGLDIWHATGMRNHYTEWMSVLADMYSKAGQPEQGLDLVEEALVFMQQSDEFYHEAELYRLRGLLRLSLDQSHAEEAEADFHSAISAARRMEAKMCELRATVSLCRLWLQQDKWETAWHQLSDIYNWFTEGFGTRDLQEAKALLMTLDKSK
jgi:adenylate cyclase